MQCNEHNLQYYGQYCPQCKQIRYQMEMMTDKTIQEIIDSWEND